MTLRSRLALGLVIIAAVLVVPLVVARSSMQDLHGQVRSLREGEFQASLSSLTIFSISNWPGVAL